MSETIDLTQQPDGAWAPPDKPPANAGNPSFIGTSTDGGKSFQPEAIVTPTVDYNELPKLSLCSANRCSAGHEWQPIIQLARCPGCASPLLAVKMLNCPICNEPVESFRLRSDHLPQGGAIMPMCRGSESLAEVQMIEMRRQAAAKEETTHKEREMCSKI